MESLSPKNRICLHVLRDEYLEAAEMMNSSEVIDSIGVEGFRTWPVFREFRSSKEFQEAYKKSFDQDYVPDPERDASTIERQEEVLSESIEETHSSNVDDAELVH